MTNNISIGPTVLVHRNTGSSGLVSARLPAVLTKRCQPQHGKAC